MLVASFDPSVLRSSGIELAQTLWAHGISAELARDARSPEDLLSSYRDGEHSWFVIIKQDNQLKIKTMGATRKDNADVDIPAKELLSWLKSEIRERESRSGQRALRNTAAGMIPHSDSAGASLPSAGLGAGVGGEIEPQDVHVLVAQTKSKKFNRRAVVEQAQASAGRLVRSFLEGPIAAIETSDLVLDLVKTTSLSDAESWRRIEHAVGTTEKRYVREIHDMLKQWREEMEEGNKRGGVGSGGGSGGAGNAFVYNFRTGKCVYYDLGA